jgi:hypothetical protein
VCEVQRCVAFTTNQDHSLAYWLQTFKIIRALPVVNTTTTPTQLLLLLLLLLIGYESQHG